MSDLGTTAGKPLIESDRVEGTTVFEPESNDIGHQAAYDRKTERTSGLCDHVVRWIHGHGVRRAHNSMEKAELRHKLRWLQDGYHGESVAGRADVLPGPKLGLE